MNLNKLEKFKNPEYWPAVVLLLLCCDVVAVNLAYFAALWLRFGRIWWQIPESYLRAWKQFAPLYTALCLGVFAFVGLYSSRLYFGRLWPLLILSTASPMTSVVHMALITTFWLRMPNSYTVGGAALQFLFVASAHVLVWLVLFLRRRQAEEARRRAAWARENAEDW